MIGGITEKGIRIIGCGQAPIQCHWRKCLEYIQKGEVDLTAILTHRFSFLQIVEVNRRFDSNEDDFIKTFIRTKFSKPPSPSTAALTNFENA